MKLVTKDVIPGSSVQFSLVTKFMRNATALTRSRLVAAKKYR